MADGRPNFELCKVIRVDDPMGGDRIIARFASDNDKRDSELPWASPFLPKMLHVKPKVGEVVAMFNINDGNTSPRFYIGPFITQQTDTYYSPKDSTEIGDARAFFEGAYQTVDENPENKDNGKAIGAFPADDDISIEGRKNCGLQITDDDIRLKAGVKKLNTSDHTAEFNREDPAFIKLKYDDTHPENGYNSVAYVVADRINLLGNTSGGKDNGLNDYKTDITTKYGDIDAYKRDLITNKEEKNILRSPEDKDFDGNMYAYRLVYGEPLIQFLELFRDAFLNHVHPFPTMKPCKTEELKNLEDYKLDKKLLSDTVRIN